jgi:Ca-activated chloride channel family protein
MSSMCGLYVVNGPPVPLQGVEVTGEVVGGLTKVSVKQRYRNVERRPIEAVYTFPLPSDAALVGFAMTCAGRRLEGVVKERERAFADYDDAVMDGHGAALLEEERKNVFTASVGNLLPDEETLIEIAYVQRVRADEGALRWSIPTLVAPRYVPGKKQGDRTGHGTADPTDRVPDADRLTPPIGGAEYGLSIDVLFDLGRDVEIESPSHGIDVSREGSRVRARFRQDEVPLDRDVVLIARNLDVDEPLTTVATHRDGKDPGVFAMTVVPDLGAARQGDATLDVVFVIDTSGSMDGESLPQAKAALSLCLRHLREGDRFNVIAFSDTWRGFERGPVPFTQKTLERADAWVSALAATGGTEMREPLVHAVKAARDGVIVLLTDGQVSNENEILEAVLRERRSARVFTFGIGTNVSDQLLLDLAKRTAGGAEMIHPGERIDDKVLATFARAVAPRVTGVKLRWEGIDADELTPSALPPLVDGEPWVLLGRFSKERSGAAILEGELDGRPWRMRVPVDLSEPAPRPSLVKLWAAERVRDLEGIEVTGRRETRVDIARESARVDRHALKERVIELAVAHGVSSKYTAFIVVEKREGDRRAGGVPEVRQVPVHEPAGWAAFPKTKSAIRGRATKMKISAGVAYSVAPPAMGGATRGSPPAPAAPAPREAAPEPAMYAMLDAGEERAGVGSGAPGGGGYAPPSFPMGRVVPAQTPADPLAQAKDLLAKQLATGLWSGDSDRGPTAATARGTAWALAELAAAGVTTSHPLYGGQIKKAVEAALDLARSIASTDPEAAELLIAAAALAADGPKTRASVAKAAPEALKPLLQDPAALRRRIDALSASLA